MIAGFRRHCGTIGCGTTGSGTAASADSDIGRGKANSIPTAAPMSRSDRTTAGSQAKASPSSRSGTRIESNAVMITTTPPSATAVLRRMVRIVLLPIGKERAPRFAQSRRAEHHKLNGDSSRDRDTGTADDHDPRLNAREGSGLHRPVDNRLRSDRIEPDSLAVATPVGCNVDR